MIKSSFLQGFHHEQQITLGHISYTAMKQLCTPAGCSFAEICLFKQQCFEAPG